MMVNDGAEIRELLLSVKNWLSRLVKQNQSDVYIFFAGHGLASEDGSKMYLLNEGVYPDVHHQVCQFFATKSNYTRLKKSIYNENFISYLLPNLNQSTIRNNL